MNNNTLIYLKTALKLKCRVLDFTYLDTIAIRFGKHRYFFRGGSTPFNSGSAIDLSKNKFCMNKMLENAGVPVPKAIGITREEFEEGNFSFKDLQYPLVAKPTVDTSLGKGVLCNIKDKKTLLSYLEESFKEHKVMSVEEFHANLTCYRILVFYGKVIGVVERKSANVTGDGKQTIQQLIDQANIKRQEKKADVTMQLIEVDQEVRICLNEQNITLETIPEKDQEVMLCYTANSSRGGSIRSLGTMICKPNAELAAYAAKTLGLNYTGFDVVCEDITKPMAKSGGVFIEANHNPDITIHENPLEGRATPVSRKLIAKLIRRHFIGYISELLRLRAIFSNIFVRVGILVGLFFLIKHYFF
ncbi:MAG: UDP-N-acetylmuramyl peptide synthase [Coxiellaceae bacterium]|nr:UDP-N-acetylmuramyl peptide synthase [Coxiellaceae bacterium]